MPQFPEFNDSWPFPVQIKWLEVYEALAMANKSKEVTYVKDDKVRG
jgi:hypothetical protein